MNWVYYDPIFECDTYNLDMLKYSPWSGHRRFAYDLISNYQPEVVVELGSFYGCSYFSFAQAIKDNRLDTNLYGVDVWRAFEGDSFVYDDYSEEIWKDFCEIKNSCYYKDNYHALRMTFDEACSKFDDDSIDILHIDGSHEYKDVKHDFETWKNKVKKTGIVLFHDVGDQRVYGQKMGSHFFWEEIKNNYSTYTFDYSFGLGMLFFDKEKYEDFFSSIDLSYYASIFYQEEVDQKDELRKRYFSMRDYNLQMDDLKKSLENEKNNVCKYKETIKGKDNYIEDLQVRLKKNEEDLKKVKEEIKTAYEATLEETRKAYTDEAITINKAYESTIKMKDNYISDLERRLSLMKTEPRLSVIIPVYNTAKYLSRCLDSVINQIYRNIEIIIVNDGSSDESEKIINNYLVTNPRIKYVRHSKNMGLFQARLSGSRVATGDYIAFLDSDDYVLRDYYYALMRKAISTFADIVIGRTVLETEDGRRELLHFHDCATSIEILIDDEIENNFWSYEGRCYSWHTIWNKIYKKDLWDKAFPFYQTIQGHLVMTEDIAFSAVLFHFANRMVSTKNSAYFYCERSDASTNSDKANIEKYKKNISDIAKVFDFIEDFLKAESKSDELLAHEKSFRDYYTKMWLDYGVKNFCGDDKQLAIETIQKLNPLFDEDTCQREVHFYDSERIPWNDGIETAKEHILDSKVHYISFDIFDTLIFRPLYDPSKLFMLLDELYTKHTGDRVIFSKIRCVAETIARRNINLDNGEQEDVTLDEIYETIASMIDVSPVILSKMKEREIELELKLCYRRKTIGELFELAKYIGKPIILVSDMYLPKEIIEKILNRNGYEGYYKLYISSETRKLKRSGKLYDYILDELDICGDEVIHFGDSWQNDIEKAQEKGINTFFIPKAIEVFENKIIGRNTNNCALLEEVAAGWICESNAYRKSLGYGAMMAIVAQHYFDNPYRVFFGDSDLNIDPFFIGYYLVGMHLFGFTKWLISESKKLGYETLCFLSRDGYLPYIMYQHINLHFDNAPKAIYMRTSRKAMMPYIVRNANDIYAYPTEIRAQTPMSMRKLLMFCAKNIEISQYKELLLKEDILPDEKFNDDEHYYRFVRFFIEKVYDEQKHKMMQKLCSVYFSDIDSKTAMVDMGYSARIQGAISAAVGHGVDVFFIHSDNNHYLYEERINNFSIHSFYDYSPCISGLFREYLLSGTEPSCIGYEKQGENIKCIFDENKYGVVDVWINKEIQRGMETFIKNFMDLYGTDKELLSIKPHEVSFPFEGYLRTVSDTDLRLFNASLFEDDVWGGQTHISMAQFLKEQKEQQKKFGYIIKEVDGKYVAKIKKVLNRMPWIKNTIEKIMDIIWRSNND